MVILSGIIPYRLPFLIEPSKIRFVIGNPFLDGLPRRLHGFVIEGGLRWTGKVDDSFPKTVETEVTLRRKFFSFLVRPSPLR